MTQQSASCDDDNNNNNNVDDDNNDDDDDKMTNNEDPACGQYHEADNSLGDDVTSCGEIVLAMTMAKACNGC